VQNKAQKKIVDYFNTSQDDDIFDDCDWLDLELENEQPEEKKFKS